ncbi:hypothetical protein ACJX0J_038763, partial [Zea mays]
YTNFGYVRFKVADRKKIELRINSADWVLFTSLTISVSLIYLLTRFTFFISLCTRPESFGKWKLVVLDLFLCLFLCCLSQIGMFSSLAMFRGPIIACSQVISDEHTSYIRSHIPEAAREPVTIIFLLYKKNFHGIQKYTTPSRPSTGIESKSAVDN